MLWKRLQNLLKFMEYREKKLKADTLIAAIALVVSGISIVISCITLYQEKKMNLQNLQAIYFKEIFQEYLIYKIPQAALKLNFDGEGKLKVSYRKINDTMMKMIKGARYFVFADRDFYNDLKSKTQYLEDELAVLSNKRVQNKDEQDKAIIHINMIISDVVDFINKKYCK